MRGDNVGGRRTQRAAKISEQAGAIRGGHNDFGCGSSGIDIRPDNNGQAAQGVGMPAMLSGGSAGLLAGLAIGVAMYLGLLRIPTKHLFTVTGWMILLLAAGMASQAANFLVQADMLPAWGKLWDVSSVLSNQSMLGSLLHTLVGYDASPMGIQMAVYVATILLIGMAMKIVQTLDQNKLR